MTRPLAILTCALAGHRWGVECRTRSGLYAPRHVCTRCGLPRWADELPLKPGQLAAASVSLLCVAAAVALAVLTAGGAW